jgi:F0F1-type ATP synthase assembly protein I
MDKDDFYKGVRAVGFVVFIPFILAAGPLSGYFAGSFLKQKFNLSNLTVILGALFGFLAAVVEVARIIKIIARENRK